MIQKSINMIKNPKPPIFKLGFEPVNWVNVFWPKSTRVIREHIKVGFQGDCRRFYRARAKNLTLSR
jgi:hypothetical protein